MRLTLLALAAGLLAAGNAAAGPSPQTADLNVSASVARSCMVTSTDALAFGEYDPAQANFANPLDGTGAVNVRCTRDVSATVTLDEGQAKATGSSCGAPQRQMSGGTERLRYDIYQDSNRTSAWGCDAANAATFTSAASNAITSLTAYGRIPAGQDVAAGSFSDTVRVTVTF